MTARTDESGLLCEVHEAIGLVEDPEYPGLSIVDLGILESVRRTPLGVRVGLVPTFSGCPALAVIAGDVRDAVAGVGGAGVVEVVWLRSPAWSTERLSARALKVLAEDFTVSVQIRSQAPLCPRCGAQTTPHSIFGPSRCRSVHVCGRCREPIEVLRG